MSDAKDKTPAPAGQPGDREPRKDTPKPRPVAETGGRKGPDPTRYGDWEKNGRCIDF